MTREALVNSCSSAYIQNISIGPHHLFADEPAVAGDADSGPNPYELMVAALCACTSMTARMYTEWRNWPLEKVQVDVTFLRLHATDCDDCNGKKATVYGVERRITFIGDLSETQQQRRLQVAMNYRVHRLPAHTVKIATLLNAGTISAATQNPSLA